MTCLEPAYMHFCGLEDALQLYLLTACRGLHQDMQLCMQLCGESILSVRRNMAQRATPQVLGSLGLRRLPLLQVQNVLTWWGPCGGRMWRPRSCSAGSALCSSCWA